MRISFPHMRRFGGVFLWIVAFELIAMTIGARTQDSAAGWYGALEKPPLTPPDGLFPVVWSFLYALIAIAGWTIWQRRRQPDYAGLLAVFVGYMVLNWSWSFVFFGAQALLPALVWIVLIDILSIILILRARHDARSVAVLMILPTLWTMFATYLNAGLLIMN